MPTPFSRLEFATIFSTQMGFSPAVALATDDGGVARAATLVYAFGAGPFRQAIVPPFVQYTPLLVDGSLSADEQQAAARTVLRTIRTTYAGAALHVLPEWIDARCASWDGWSVSPLYTYRLDLGTSEDVEREWSESARRTSRKHRGAFSVDEDSKRAPEVIRLCAKSYARHRRRIPASENKLVAATDMLVREGLARVFVATPARRTEPAAGIVILGDEKIAHYWIAGSEPGPSMTVLLSNVLRCLGEDGFHEFDFVGANTPSIAEFKRRFGPKLSHYFRFECISARGLRLVNWIRRMHGKRVR